MNDLEDVSRDSQLLRSVEEDDLAQENDPELDGLLDRAISTTVFIALGALAFALIILIAR